MATAVGALPELMGDHLNLVPSGDGRTFTEQLCAAVSDPATVPPELRARIADMTWSNAAQTMADLYRRVAC